MNTRQSGGSSQESLKSLNHSENEVGVVLHRLRYVHEVTGLAIFDNYDGGKLSLLFDVQPRFIRDDVRRALKVCGTSVSVPRFAILIHDANAVNVPGGQDRNKQPMFISDVKVVNGPNGLIPSIARLYLVEHKSKQIRGSSVYASLRHPSFKFFEDFANRELGPVINEGGNQSVDGLEPGIVEGAIQIMDSVPEQQGDIVEGGSIAESVGEDFPSRFRININSSCVRFMQAGDSCVDIRDVLIGPFDLQTGIS
jgi:hypothetical protein